MKTAASFSPARDKHYEFDVALSFAEEDRAFVERVAAQLNLKGLRIYYDDYKRTETWGQDLSTHLDDVYRNKARFCLMFISEHYKRKRWTQYERDSARASQVFSRYGDYILPFRLDDTVIEGIPDTIIYLSAGDHNEKALALVMLEKVMKDREQRAALAKRKKRSVSGKAGGVLALIAVSGIATFGLADRLTPVDELAKRLHDRSMKTSIARCKDGTFSWRRGTGTCSHHGGVDQYLDSVFYTKSEKECREEAARISWRKQ